MVATQGCIESGVDVLLISSPLAAIGSTDAAKPHGWIAETQDHDVRVNVSQKDVTRDFSRLGKPADDAFIESFNGKFRAECLNTP